jgi:hypothetical protein
MEDFERYIGRMWTEVVVTYLQNSAIILLQNGEVHLQGKLSDTIVGVLAGI